MKTPARLFKYLIFCLLALVAVHAPLQSLQAADSESAEAALIESMKERLPELMRLKLDGKVGETNMGLVEARDVLERDQRRMLSEENSDRLAHYKIIADKLGIPVAAVQRKRAEQIRENSPRGVWIESKDGVWFRE